MTDDQFSDLQKQINTLRQRVNTNEKRQWSFIIAILLTLLTSLGSLVLQYLSFIGREEMSSLIQSIEKIV
jgi:uncharacterized membrane protein